MILSGKVVSVLDGSTFTDGRERVSIRIVVPKSSSETIVIPNVVEGANVPFFALGDLVHVTIRKVES